MYDGVSSNKTARRFKYKLYSSFSKSNTRFFHNSRLPTPNNSGKNNTPWILLTIIITVALLQFCLFPFREWVVHCIVYSCIGACGVMMCRLKVDKPFNMRDLFTTFMMRLTMRLLTLYFMGPIFLSFPVSLITLLLEWLPYWIMFISTDTLLIGKYIDLISGNKVNTVTSLYPPPRPTGNQATDSATQDMPPPVFIYPAFLIDLSPAQWLVFVKTMDEKGSEILRRTGGPVAVNGILASLGEDISSGEILSLRKYLTTRGYASEDSWGSIRYEQHSLIWRDMYSSVLPRSAQVDVIIRSIKT